MLPSFTQLRSHADQPRLKLRPAGWLMLLAGLLLAGQAAAEILLDDTFGDGFVTTNSDGLGGGWYSGSFNGGEAPVEAGGAFVGAMGIEHGISAIQGKDVFTFWDADGLTATWTIKSMTVKTPHKFTYYYAHCWEMGIISANAIRSGNSWNMSGPNKRGGFYVQVGKKDSSSQAQIWVTVSNKTFSGVEGTSGFYTPTQVSTSPGGIGPVFTATFPIEVTVRLTSAGWQVSTNQAGLAPIAGNWTTSLQTGTNNASITDEFAKGGFLFTAARNHGIDGLGKAFTPNSGEIERITVSRTVTPPAPAWDDGFSGMGNGWRQLPWFGIYLPMSEGWIWHLEHGFTYVAPASGPQGVFLYMPGMGWLWTHATYWPWLFRLNDGAWMWYAGANVTPRRFFNTVTGLWEEQP